MCYGADCSDGRGWHFGLESLAAFLMPGLPATRPYTGAAAELDAKALLS
jgi:hypothetical protein